MKSEKKYGVIVSIYDSFKVGHTGLTLYEANNGLLKTVHFFDKKDLMSVTSCFRGKKIETIEKFIKLSAKRHNKNVSIENIELTKGNFDIMLNKAKEIYKNGKFNLIIDNCNTNARKILKAPLVGQKFTQGNFIKKILKRIPTLDNTRKDIVASLKSQLTNYLKK